MKVPPIVGADLSKKTIDLFITDSQSHLCIDNHLQGFKKMISWLKSLKVDTSEMMIVMEHTGLYGYQFEEFLHARKITFAKVNALEIKRSVGMIRGKSDKIDAARIALYGRQCYQKLQPCREASASMKELRLLQSARSRIVKLKAGVQCVIKEYKNMRLPASHQVMKCELKLLRTYQEQIKKLDAAIKKAVEADPEIQKSVTLLKSVKAVGDVLAVATVIKTDNFKRFRNGRQFACFCGTAPFEHSSGTSIKTKARVSHMADKSMKTLLDLSAKCGAVHDPELREFYRRRIEAGKSKMSTINVVRNKIIYRMFAVIKRGTPFLEKAA